MFLIRLNEINLGRDDMNPDYTIRIPRAYARLETNKLPKMKDLDTIPCYELYVRNQVGSPKVRRDTLVFTRLPKSGETISIVLFMDGGVDFDKKFHTQIIRELDEKDRHILRGFCWKYQDTLQTESHIPYSKSKKYLQDCALNFRCSDIPKRIKWGSEGRDMTSFYTDLSYTDESAEEEKVSTIFDEVVFI